MGIPDPLYLIEIVCSWVTFGKRCFVCKELNWRGASHTTPKQTDSRKLLINVWSCTFVMFLPWKTKNLEWKFGMDGILVQYNLSSLYKKYTLCGCVWTIPPPIISYGQSGSIPNDSVESQLQSRDEMLAALKHHLQQAHKQMKKFVDVYR